MSYKSKHTGAVIDQQINRVIDGSVVVDNTLSALDENSNKPVSGGAVAEELAKRDTTIAGLQGSVAGKADNAEFRKESIRLQSQIDKVKPIEIVGDVTNAPDEEDITTDANNLLKLKDRPFGKGLGYKILRADKTFAEQVTDPYTIYEVRYDFNLSSDFEMPQDCTLRFVGGSIRGAKLTLTNTYIDAPCCLAILPNEVEGRATNTVIYPEWFTEDLTKDITPSMNVAINIAYGAKVLLTNAVYIAAPRIVPKSNVHIVSESQSVVRVDVDEYYDSLIYSTQKLENVRFAGITFEQTPTSYSEVVDNQVGRLIITLFNDSHNIIIENCTFKFNGTNAISVNGENSNNTLIRNNVFEFNRAHITNDRLYDVSAVYVADHYHRIVGNRITTGDGEFNRVNGGIETHGVAGVVVNNTFNNCKSCINVVNDIEAVSTDEIGRIISDNAASDCEVFLCLWPVTDYSPMANIRISNNIATNIRLSAIRAVVDKNGGVNGAMENIFISNNYFEGLHAEFNGDEYSPTVLDVFNKVAFNIMTASKITNFVIEGNTVKSFPATLVNMGLYIDASSTDVQEVAVRGNTFINCFNGAITTFYNTYYCFALFMAQRTAALEVYDNTFEIPYTITMAPLLIHLNHGASVRWSNNNMPQVKSKLVYNVSGEISGDLFTERYAKFLQVGEEDLLVKGDTVYDNGIKTYCSTSGLSIDVAVNESNVVNDNGGVYYLVDDASALKIGYPFTTQIGTSSSLPERIAAIIGDRIYTERWATLRGYIKENQTTSASMEFTKAIMLYGTAGTDASPAYTNLGSGAMYYSLGLNRPAWKSKSGAWVDVFGRVIAEFQGTWATRPNNASFAHPFMLLDRRVPIWKNSTGADNWIYADGYNAALPRKGTTAERPDATMATAGFTYYDTDLKKMIVSNGSSWTNMDGTSL